MKYLDALLDKITMYRLVLYYLLALVAFATIAGIFHWLPYSPVAVIGSAFFIVAVCWISNTFLAWLFGAETNVESVYITGLILALIITPQLPSTPLSIALPVFASLVAMASKYVIAFHKKHFLNPAAIGVVVTAFAIGGYASWWVGGNLVLLPVVLIGGLLIARKIRRFDLVLCFIVAAILTIVLTTPSGNALSTAEAVLIHTPVFFFAFVMLTEPFTTPPTRVLRMVYAVLVGILFAPALHIGSIHSSPELALIIGNMFSFIVSSKGRFTLTLKRIEKMSANASEFIFSTNRPLAFTAGQYMEWTLPHEGADDRGNRRYFTIASSPHESDVRLGVRFYENPSTFKRILASLKVGENITATGIAGDFVLPKDATKKLVLVAGGIGITPFRSQIQHMLDTGTRRDIVVLYLNRTEQDAAYRDLLKRAENKLGIKVLYMFDDAAAAARRSVNKESLPNVIPDFKDRIFYISGSQGLVASFRTMLIGAGVSRSHIKTDYFPGLA